MLQQLLHIIQINGNLNLFKKTINDWKCFEYSKHIL